MNPSERAGSIVAAIKTVHPFADHGTEIAVMLMIRDAIQRDRHECAMEVARQSTNLLSDQLPNQSASRAGE